MHDDAEGRRQAHSSKFALEMEARCEHEVRGCATISTGANRIPAAFGALACLQAVTSRIGIEDRLSIVRVRSRDHERKARGGIKCFASTANTFCRRVFRRALRALPRRPEPHYEKYSTDDDREIRVACQRQAMVFDSRTAYDNHKSVLFGQADANGVSMRAHYDVDCGAYSTTAWLMFMCRRRYCLLVA